MNLSPRSSRNNDREDSEISGSDFSETECGREAKRQHRREYNQLHSLTADELEEDDLQAEQDYVQETEVRLPPQPKGRKGKAHRPAWQEHDDDNDEQAGQEQDYIQETEVRLPPQPKGRKGKAHWLARQEDDDDDNEQARQKDDENDEQAGQEDEEDDEQPDDEDEGFQHRSGPLPESVKDQAYTLHRDYITAMEDLARSCGKPAKALFQLVGDENATPRALVPWNAYQSWYASCGEKKKPKESSYLFSTCVCIDFDFTFFTVPASEWTKVIVAEYQVKIHSLGD